MKKIIEYAITLVTITILSTGFAILSIEWMAGCGETYTDAYGRLHLNECVFINFPPKDYK
jgi:hypothetical protein